MDVQGEFRMNRFTTRRPAEVLTVMAVATAVLLAACSETAKLPPERTTGPTPQLAAPNPTLIPTVNIAPAVGWTDTAGPTPASGFAVTALARGLDHPRWVYVLPNGDVLVAESNKPPKPNEPKDGGDGLFAQIRQKIMGMVMKRAGAGTPSANRITLLRSRKSSCRTSPRPTAWCWSATNSSSPTPMR
jgi:glucose/arabinose dehydrogenase